MSDIVNTGSDAATLCDPKARGHDKRPGSSARLSWLHDWFTEVRGKTEKLYEGRPEYHYNNLDEQNRS
jgi:hypothetical protein